MTRDEEEARLRLLFYYVGEAIELRAKLASLEDAFRGETRPERRSLVSDQLVECRAKLADNEVQLEWLRGGHGDHTTH